MRKCNKILVQNATIDISIMIITVSYDRKPMLCAFTEVNYILIPLKGRVFGLRFEKTLYLYHTGLNVREEN